MSRALTDLDWPLRTDRLSLRPAAPEDAEAIWPWYRLPEVQEWTTTLSPTVEAHQEWWDHTHAESVVALQHDLIVAAGKLARQDAWSQADMVEQARGRQAEIGWVLDPASRRVMEKIGMRCEGVFVEESLHRSGRWLDGASYALLASEYPAQQGG